MALTELRLGWALLRRKPVAPLVQVVGLAFAVAILLLALSFWRVLHADVALPGAHCTQGVGWLSAQGRDGVSRERFTAAQVRALRQATKLALIPVLDTSAEVHVGTTRRQLDVMATDPELFAAVCVDRDHGQALDANDATAVVAGDVGPVGGSVRIGAQSFRITASGTPFRGLAAGADERVFIPLRYAASTGVDPQTVSMPVLKVLVGRAPPDVDTTSTLTTALAENRSAFPDVAALRALPGTELAGVEVDAMRRDGLLFGGVGVALLALAALNILAYQIGRQGELGWRVKILRDLGATPWRLRVFTAVEPFAIILLAWALGWLVMAGILPVLTGLLDLGRLSQHLRPTTAVLASVALPLLALACGLVELRLRMATHALPQVVRRAILAGFDYVVAVQGVGCVIALGLAAQTALGYWNARPTTRGYDIDQVRAYMVVAKPNNGIPRDFIARIRPTLRALGADVHGVAALSATYQPVLGYGWAGAVVKHAGVTDDAGINYVTPEFFDVLRMPILSGQVFGYGDIPAKDPDPNVRSGQAAVVIANTLAVRDLRLQPTIGAVMTVASDASNEVPVPVRTVGVVDEKTSGTEAADDKLGATLYAPFLPISNSRPIYQLLVRHDASLPPAQVDRAALRTIQTLTPGAAVRWRKPLQAIFDEATARERSVAWLFALLGCGALALALSGLFALGVLRADLLRLQHAIHFALGAPAAQRARRHILDLLVPLVIGLGVGACALWMGLSLLADTLHLDAEQGGAICAVTALALLAAGGAIATFSAGGLRRADFGQWLKSE